jgi:hypothetical protein
MRRIVTTIGTTLAIGTGMGAMVASEASAGIDVKGKTHERNRRSPRLPHTSPTREANEASIALASPIRAGPASRSRLGGGAGQLRKASEALGVGGLGFGGVDRE